MRSDREFDAALNMMEARIEDAENAEHPLQSVVLAFHRAKKVGLTVAKESNGGQHWEVRDNLDARLALDLSLPEFVQTQAMKNALAWAEEETDNL